MTRGEARTAARAKAAAEREARQRRRRRNRVLGVGGGVLGALVVAGVVAGVVVAANSGTTAAAGSGTPDAGRTDAPPWSAPADASARAKAAGLSMLAAEGEALHIHQHLTVTVDRKAQPVPADIGIDEAAQRISPIHTHDGTGVVHVESPVVKTFTLGEVFTEWDVALAPGRIGPYRDGHDGDRVALFVDRKRYSGDPRRLALGAKQDIDFVVTTDGSAPAAPTTAYRFPAGY